MNMKIKNSLEYAYIDWLSFWELNYSIEHINSEFSIIEFTKERDLKAFCRIYKELVDNEQRNDSQTKARV